MKTVLRSIFLFVALLLITLGLPLAGHAAMFDVRISVNNVLRYSASFDTAKNLITSMETRKVQAQTAYKGYEKLTGLLNYRGLHVILEFPTVGGTTLTMNIPSIGVTRSFTGPTRDASIDLLKRWFEKEGAETVARFMRELAKTTVHDPVAGNPNSLASTMIGHSFDRGFLDKVSALVDPAQVTVTKEGDVNANLFSFGLRYGSFTQDGRDVRFYALPLGYTWRANRDDRRQLALSLPVRFITMENSQAYSAGLGLALSLPVTGRTSRHQWILTPSVDYGVTGSIDLGSVGQIVQGGITSSYTTWIGNVTLNIGNMASYYQTMRFAYGDYSFDPGISNYVFRNALMLGFPTGGFIPGTFIEFFVIDTRLTGTKLAINEYQEFGFSFGYAKVGKHLLGSSLPDPQAPRARGATERFKNTLRTLRLGATYVYADRSRGFTVNMGYSF